MATPTASIFIARSKKAVVALEPISTKAPMPPVIPPRRSPLLRSMPALAMSARPDPIPLKLRTVEDPVAFSSTFIRLSKAAVVC